MLKFTLVSLSILSRLHRHGMFSGLVPASHAPINKINCCYFLTPPFSPDLSCLLLFSACVEGQFLRDKSVELFGIIFCLN